MIVSALIHSAAVALPVGSPLTNAAQLARSSDAGLPVRVFWRERVPLGAMRPRLTDVESLSIQVDVVVSNGAEKQMVRPNARADIASVQHPQAIGDRAVRQLPRDAVGVLQDRFAADLIDSELAVTDAGPRSRPQPAFGFDMRNLVAGCLVDLRPEPRLQTLLGLGRRTWRVDATARPAGVAFPEHQLRRRDLLQSSAFAHNVAISAVPVRRHVRFAHDAPATKFSSDWDLQCWRHSEKESPATLVRWLDGRGGSHPRTGDATNFSTVGSGPVPWQAR